MMPELFVLSKTSIVSNTRVFHKHTEMAILMELPTLYLQLLPVLEQTSVDVMSKDWYKIYICSKVHRPYQTVNIIEIALCDICSKFANTRCPIEMAL